MPAEPIMLKPHGWVPNNPNLPVLLYRQALQAGGDFAEAAEAVFRRNDWPPRWRGSIVPYHHYHTTAHEVLAVADGAARVLLGGPDGVEIELGERDVVVLPAGTGHCLLYAEADFLVVGAYPQGQEWDILRDAADVPTLERIAAVPVPEVDPVEGRRGALLTYWN